MIVNLKLFQAMFISKKRNNLSGILKLKNNREITQRSSVVLLGVTIDNELKLDQHDVA